MLSHRVAHALLLATISPAALMSGPAFAQNDAIDEATLEEVVDDIVVTGTRERGAVLGDIRPEEQLNAADVRALGISTINDLLTELGPQLRSASGQPPVTLLEGKRISSFREIATLPAEAIARVDILPEEVGLRYGYGSDRRVMNIVLRQRFRAFDGELTGRIPTDGGGKGGEVEAGFLSIRNGERVNLNADFNTSARLLETQRGLTDVESGARTLRPFAQQLTVNGSYHKPLTERTQATLTAEGTTSLSESNVGLALPAVRLPGGGPDDTFQPFANGIGALERSNRAQTGTVGLTLNALRSAGQWTLTAGYTRNESRGITARGFDLTAYGDAVAAGDPLADPSLPVAQAFLIARPADDARSRSDTANVDFVYNRNLLRLPAGDLSTTVRLSGSTLELESTLERNLVVSGRSIGRQRGGGSVSVDIPITRAGGSIGRLSANANAGVDQLSDAGTLRSFGGGLNWTPRKGIALSASYRDDESAPTPQQLGDPQDYTQNVPVFDSVLGETATVTTITGGNPLLNAARIQSLRLGLTLNPLADPNLMLSVNYNHRLTKGGIAAFPGVSEATEDAFPGRFVRDVDGHLTLIDLRPINIVSQKRDTLRWGFNISKRLKTPQSQIDAMRAAAQRRFAQGGFPGGRPPQVGANPAGQGGAPAANGASAAGNNNPETAAAAPSAATTPGGVAGRPGGQAGNAGGPGAGFAGGGRGPGGFGGGGQGGGRLNFSVYHEIALQGTTQLLRNMPVLDLLGGDSLGGGAGPSRHEVEVQAGFSQSGYGLRLTGEWKSATHVTGLAGIPSSQLRFGDLATVNVRLFANLTQMPSLVEKVPFLRGARVQLSVDNLFNARQHVTDGNGVVPFAYNPAYLDPVGRSVRVSFRKLFF